MFDEKDCEELQKLVSDVYNEKSLTSKMVKMTPVKPTELTREKNREMRDSPLYEYVDGAVLQLPVIHKSFSIRKGSSIEEVKEATFKALNTVLKTETALLSEAKDNKYYVDDTMEGVRSSFWEKNDDLYEGYIRVLINTSATPFYEDWGRISL